MSARNEALATQHQAKITALLGDAGYTVRRAMNMDCGWAVALIVENPDAEFTADAPATADAA